MRILRKPTGCRLPEHKMTVPGICCNTVVASRTLPKQFSSFAAAPLLEPLQQRVNVKVASPSLIRGHAAADGAGGVGAAPAVTHSSDNSQRQSSLQAAGSTSAGHGESQQSAGSETERVQSAFKAPERRTSHHSPVTFALRTLNDALSNGKAIAHWILCSLALAPFKFAAAIFRQACLLIQCRGTSDEHELEAEAAADPPSSTHLSSGTARPLILDRPLAEEKQAAIAVVDTTVTASKPNATAVATQPPVTAEGLQNVITEEGSSEPDVHRESGGEISRAAAPAADDDVEQIASSGADAGQKQVVRIQTPGIRRVTKLASARMERTVRRGIERRGEVYTGVDMEELFPACWVLVDQELGMLGEGSFAQVVYAELEIQGNITTLAVKLMKDTADLDMIDDEIAALAAVRGMPRFVQEVDAKYHQSTDDNALVVTRLVEGGHLAVVVHLLLGMLNRPGGVERFFKAVVRIFSQIVEGVQQLHNIGRSHNDLKPENILVCNWEDMEHSEVVILDVAGSMQVGTWDGFDMPQASASFTAPDVLAAVVHLASSNEGWTLPVDFLAHDKWSLGCILSFMLSGCVAFDWPANQPPSSPSLEDEYACVLQRQQEWGHALRGEPIQSAPSNAVEVMCNTLSGYKLSQAQQLVRSLLKPNAEARPALADISLEFLLQ